MCVWAKFVCEELYVLKDSEVEKGVNIGKAANDNACLVVWERDFKKAKRTTVILVSVANDKRAKHSWLQIS